MLFVFLSLDELFVLRYEPPGAEHVESESLRLSSSETTIIPWAGGGGVVGARDGYRTFLLAMVTFFGFRVLDGEATDSKFISRGGDFTDEQHEPMFVLSLNLTHIFLNES